MSIVLAYRSLDGFAIALIIHSLEGFTIALIIHSLEGFTIALIIHSLDPTGVERWNYFLHSYDAPPLLSCRRQINSLLRGGGDA